MIKEIVDKWEANKELIRQAFILKQPENYGELVGTVIAHITNGVGPDPQRIHEIDDGDYQGTLLYVIASKGYQPSSYYYCKISYGSCSGCDTLQAVMFDSDNKDKEIEGYVQLALHVVQNLKEME